MKKFFESIYTPVAWTLLIQVLLCLPGSSLSDMPDIRIPHFDKLVHIVLFGILASLWCYYFYCKGFSPEKLRKVFLWVFLAAILNGILLELVQYFFVPDRSFDGGDILANAAGAGMAYIICRNKLLKINSKLQ